MEIINNLINDVSEYNSTISNNRSEIYCIEEMFKLTKILADKVQSKKLRKLPRYNMKKMKEEVSNVLLACAAIAREYCISDEEIYKEQQKAIQRMNESKKGE